MKRKECGNLRMTIYDLRAAVWAPFFAEACTLSAACARPESHLQVVDLMRTCIEMGIPFGSRRLSHSRSPLLARASGRLKKFRCLAVRRAPVYSSNR